MSEKKPPKEYEELRELEKEYIEVSEQIQTLKDRQLEIMKKLLPLQGGVLRSIISDQSQKIQTLEKELGTRSNNLV